MSQASAGANVRNVVLVHGGFVDGSGWEGVYKALKRNGYVVSIVQNPTLSLADDVAVTKRTLATQSGPVILVGHSYGGAVITEAGNDPKVVGLVCVAAFALDKGESVSALIKNPPPGATSNAAAHPDVRIETMQVKPAPATSIEMAEAVRAGKLTIPLGQRFALAEANKAHRAAEKGASGKLLLLA